MTATDPPTSPAVTGLLEALPSPVLVIDARLCVRFANPAAETLFSLSRSALQGTPLADILPFDSPVFDLIARLQRGEQSISEYDIALMPARGAAVHLVDAHLAQIPDYPGAIAVVLQPSSVAHQLDQHVTHRDAARSVSTMAATLAHEIKTPLAGIRGAAQLLEAAISREDRPLARLIRDETDRIHRLIERMEAFTDSRPIQGEPVNIHEVLDHVRMLAETSFGQHLRFFEDYDPSLPPVAGDRDKLIQVFLNLIRNAAEAAPKQNGEVALRTLYQHGLRMAVPHGGASVHVPITVWVSDNGAGVPESMSATLFEPFVSGRANGTGLGLSLVAKIIGDHHGGIDFENNLRGATFRIRLPAYRAPRPRVPRQPTGSPP